MMKSQDQYIKICDLGTGSYGTVHLAQRKRSQQMSLFQSIFQSDNNSESQYVAIKIYSKPKNTWEGIDFSCLREISCLQAVRHPNVLNCIQVISKIYKDKDQQKKKFQIAVVMDFHLQLSDLLRAHSSPLDRKRMIKQIVKGLSYLHQNYIFHRDLKPQNIFVSRQGMIKIADFGFAKQFGTPYKKYTINACTIEYRAPEIFCGTHYYTQKSDIWSLGCVIAYILTLKKLFKTDNKSQIELLAEMFYLSGTPDEVNWPGSTHLPIQFNYRHETGKNLALQLDIQNEAGAMLTRCLKIDPRQRASALELLDDPYFKDVSDEPFDIAEIYEAKLYKLTYRYI